MVSRRDRKERRNLDPIIIPDILFFKASFTGRKITESDGVAWNIRGELGVNAAFRPLPRYNDYHSPDEPELTGEANAALKILESYPAFVQLKPGNSRHKWFADTLARERLIENPKRFDPRHTILLGDDQTLAAPLPVYEAMKPFLRPYVDERFLEHTEKKFEGQPFASLPHFSYMLSAGGPERFANIVRVAARNAGYGNQPVPVYSEIAYAMIRMSDPDAASLHKFDSSHRMVLWAPDGLARRLRRPRHPVHQVEDFFHDGKDPSAPVTHASYSGWVTETGARRDVVAHAIQWAAQDFKPRTAAIYDFKVAREGQRALRGKPPAGEVKKPRLVQPIGFPQTAGASIEDEPRFEIDGKPVKKIGKIDIVVKSPRTEGNEHNWFDSFSNEFDFGHRNGNECPDFALMPPINPRNPEHIIQAALASSSDAVNGDLDPRHGTTIYLNLNGCWDDTLRAHHRFANDGLGKNYMWRAIHDKREPGKPIVNVEGVTHTADYLHHVVSGSDIRSLVKAAKQIMTFRRERYARLEPEDRFEAQIEQKENGTAAPAGMQIVLPILSHSSTLKPQNADVYAYMRWVAENRMGMVWGGGDDPKFPMGRARRGFLDGGGLWHCAVSTHSLTKIETEHGRLPDCDYWQLSRAISPRLLGLFTGITHAADNRRIFDPPCVVPDLGGACGTRHEGAVLLGLMHYRPELVKDTWLCFYVPPYSSQVPNVRSLLGRHDTRRLFRNHDALADRRVVLATDMKELQDRTLECAAASARSRAVAPVRQAYTAA